MGAESLHNKDDTSPATVSRTVSLNDAAHEKAGASPAASAPKGAKLTGRSILLMSTICSGGFLFGYDIGVISGCLIMRDFVLRFGGGPSAGGGWALPADTQAHITALLGAGTFFGSLFQAPLSDWMGRQKSMLVWSLVFVVGAVIQTSTETAVAQLMVGRLIAGLAVGALSGLCPLYLGETAPKAIRGIIVSGYQLLVITGIVVSYGITWASQTAEFSSASWRIPVGLQMLWGLILFGLVCLLPESPRWEMQRGNLVKAKGIMASMRGITLEDGPAGPRGDAAMEEEFAEMEAYISKEREVFQNSNYITAYRKCFVRDKQMWRRTLTGMLLQTFQQLNGQNFYYYYGPTFFQSAALQLNSYQIQFILGVVSWVCTFPALWLVERVGRRALFLGGSITCFVCAMIVGLVGHFSIAAAGTLTDQITSAQKSAGSAFVAFAIIHLAGYSVGVGPVPWVILSESFPQEVRAKSISLGATTNWFWNFMLSWFSPGLSEKYGPLILVIFAGIIFAAILFTFFVLPETRGLSVEEIDLLYSSGAANRPWRSSQWVPPSREDIIV